MLCRGGWGRTARIVGRKPDSAFAMAGIFLKCHGSILLGRRPEVLNRFERSSPMAGEAEVKYLDGDFRVIRPGAFVRCAVTGAPIPLEELKYWSVDLQEAYSSPDAVLQRHFPEPSTRR
jgi:hypothetical protein